jgi:hypothetical protein
MADAFEPATETMLTMESIGRACGCQVLRVDWSVVGGNPREADDGEVHDGNEDGHAGPSLPSRQAGAQYQYLRPPTARPV